ncbi:MAG TPA: sigma-70 family RNA polymerase sigma factor [Nocardioidaceae bacterium]|nr:sigma-70 family RNA polymerase sigma factor [Nocardioidaceae bacterium]
MTSTQAELMQALHDEHASALWAYAVRLTGDHAHAQDVVQETLLRAWRNQRVMSQPTGSLRAWLYTVARHIVIDDWRARRVRPEFSTAEPPEPAVEDDEVDAMLQSWVVADAVGTLSVEHRDVLLETYYRGRSVAEAARRLGVPEGTVKSRTHYALRALRLALEERGVGTA